MPNQYAPERGIRRWTGTRLRTVALVLLVAVAIVQAIASARVAPEPRHPETARLIANLLAYQHFNSQPINDNLSARVFDSYLRALDPDRLYFLSSDIAEFESSRYLLDDMLLEGDLSLPYRMFNRLVQRAEERSTEAAALLEEGLDFTSEREYRIDRSEAAWARNGTDSNRLWRDRVTHDALTLLMAGEDEDGIRDLLQTRYDGMAENLDRSSAEDVFETFMGAWGRAFDPHTSYLSPRNSREFDIQMQLSLEGIGAVLRSEREFTQIVELIPGGPASKDGRLQPGDRIIGVGQANADVVDVVGWRLRDVVDLIRGPKGSEVTLRIIPEAGSSSGSPRIISLIRNEVALEAQAANSRVETVSRNGETHRIGVIELPAFYADFAAARAGDANYRSTTRDVSRLLRELDKEDIDGLVIDLRGNAGGSLQEAETLTGLFIDAGPIVQVVRSDGHREVLQDRDGDISYQGPLAVLVDRFSASASEIFAGAIQDYGRGLVIGETTFGKGTVQSLVDLDRFMNRSADPAGRLKLTIAKFYRISGSSTQKRGVEPDIRLPSVARSDDSGEAAAENALPWDQIRAVTHAVDVRVPELLTILQLRHDQRMADTPAYDALETELADRQAIAERNVVSLNRDRREARYAADTQRSLDNANRRRQALGLDPVADLESLQNAEDEPDLLLQMAAEITTDLALLLQSPATMDRWARDPSAQ